MRLRTILFALVAIAVLIGTGGYAFSVWNAYQISPTPTAAQGPIITSEFELVDQAGRTIRDDDLRGKWQLVFFGFTSCPDVCPMTLENITAALEELGPVADKLQPLLITVDPERDTPAVLKEYLAAFDPRILGLTGTPERVQEALRSFRVYAAKRPLDGGYTMDHSTFVYLMDPHGAYAVHFSPQASVEEMAKQINARISGSTSS